MTPLEGLISRFKLDFLIHAAIVCTLSSLAIMVVMTFWPIALLVVIGMGAAQVLGIAGVVLFGSSVLREVMSGARRSMLPPGPNPAGVSASGPAKATPQSAIDTLPSPRDPDASEPPDSH